ncbi:site-specific integrase [Bacteroides neonati]|uniref:site-specific integrase n=1 Tax=Bacteroides neonati TaxID=1347393 RepID=UPI0004B61A58|nr:site-specific integrase [Bacteroides neonati]
MSTMPSVRYIYDRRRTATDVKPATVEIEIYFSRQQRKFVNTGIQILPEQWNESIVVKHNDADQLNNTLLGIKKKVERILIAMDVDKEPISMQSFNARYEGAVKPTSFIDFMYDCICKRQIRDSTRRAHIAAWETVRRFGKMRTFSDLTPETLKRFDDFLRAEDPKRCQVTIHGYHKRVKPYILEAHKLRYIDYSPYDVFDVSRGTSKEREPLNQYELNLLRDAELPDKLARVRDVFVFGCYTGLSYSDICLFRYDKDVVQSNGMYYIDGERLKTGTKFYTPVLKPALDILLKYNERLPTISIQKYNDFLHVIELRLGLKKPLTSHIARHTFATTVTLANDVPIETVCRMLGHKDIKTTQIYAKILKTTVERHVETLSKII